MRYGSKGVYSVSGDVLVIVLAGVGRCGGGGGGGGVIIIPIGESLLIFCLDSVLTVSSTNVSI